MPRRDDLKKILLIGSGPIVIGQACEFDYSGTQACKALAEAGYELVLVNSNPATIMTDPELADRTYVEPITHEVLAKVIARERPDALLPTVGGQTALNAATVLYERGTLQKFGVELLGVSYEAIQMAEDRQQFKAAMQRLGLDLPHSGVAHTRAECATLLQTIGFPCVIRPSFTLGGTGGGIAFNQEEFEAITMHGLKESPTTEVLIEEYLHGWKEYELEVMRDRADNVVIVCSIENFDPMGVHTGDSITVAPALTLTDREYQRLRDASIAIIREIGVETGGSNIQFAVNPRDGRLVVIEMNPRVSRSSALASKATGFPIAKMAAKLAVGYTLDEIPNDITKKTPASFEPSIDYCVVKVPRWAFEKFPGASTTLTTQMKSVGEAMAIGRTFTEAFQKAIRSLEIGRMGLGLDREDPLVRHQKPSRARVKEQLLVPNIDRVFAVRFAFKHGFTIEEIARLTGLDPWFLHQIKSLVRFEETLDAAGPLAEASFRLLREAKRHGYSDAQLATHFRTDEPTVRARRRALGLRPTYKLVDTCAGEFEAYTPYYYATYGDEDELPAKGERERVMILGGGPNRIGQGIEFDYCCCHAAFAVKELGYEAVMVNCNPETVSTDFDTSDLLFFEPLTVEDVLNLTERLEPVGVIVQFGGQTPLNLARELAEQGVPIVGTPPEAIDRAEDREQFLELVTRLGLRQPDNGTATTAGEACTVARRVGYPVVVRPSYVLGGRAMEVVFDDEALVTYMTEAVEASPDRPVLIDHFLEAAVEVDVDAIADRTGAVVIGGIMEHIEEAGIHSGDSSCVIPPYTLSETVLDEIRVQTVALARELGVVGLMNVQYAVRDGVVYLLEVNPRASRTVPFVAKATGVPLARIAAKVMLGRTLAELGVTLEVVPTHLSVKKPVFPFTKFSGADVLLGPEMKSTGEVMGSDPSLGVALAKAQLGAGIPFPLAGTVFLSVRDGDKRAIVPLAREFSRLGFSLLATRGTASVLRRQGLEVEIAPKIQEGRPDGRPNIKDRIISGEVHLVVNTPRGKDPLTDEATIRKLAVARNIPVLPTISAAQAAVVAIEALARGDFQVHALQDFHRHERPLSGRQPSAAL